MKLSKIFLTAAVCAALTILGTTSVSAEEPLAISEFQEISVSALSDRLDTPLSPGIRVISYEKPLILSGAIGDSIQFSAEIFDDHSGYVPSSIRILSLPDTDSGILKHDSNAVSIGQSVSVLSLSSLSYEPKSNDDAEFMFSPDGTTVVRCIIRQKDGKNTPPTTSGDEAVTTYTKLDTVVSGYLDGTDPDGHAVNFEIEEYPSKGILSVKDPATGHFIYHPYEGMSGSDSFSYRICDSYGEYSQVYTAEISIDNTKANIYDDMKDSYHTAAVHDAVKAGIMETRRTADGEFFDPDEPVSRIDFLIMAMKTMGAGEVSAISSTPFYDDNSLTEAEKGYLSAAYRLGIVKGTESNGKLMFMPNEAVTGADAAVMMNGVLGLPEDDSISVAAMGDDIPAWAVPSVSALTGEGLINKYTAPAMEILTREDVAVILSGLARKLA